MSWNIMKKLSKEGLIEYQLKDFFHGQKASRDYLLKSLPLATGVLSTETPKFSEVASQVFECIKADYCYQLWAYWIDKTIPPCVIYGLKFLASLIVFRFSAVFCRLSHFLVLLLALAAFCSLKHFVYQLENFHTALHSNSIVGSSQCFIPFK